MKATFNKDQFIKMLATVLPYMSSKNTIPILDNVLLRKGKDSLSMTVSDLETTIIYNMPTVNGDQFEFCFDGKQVFEILRMSSDPAFDMIVDVNEADEKKVPVKMTIELFSGSVSFPVFNADEFPVVHAVGEDNRGILPSKVVAKRKETWSNFCGHDPIRPIMSCVNLEVVQEGDARFLYTVATDAHTLFVEKMKTDTNPMLINLSQRFMHLLSKIVKEDDLIFYQNDTNVKVVKDGITIYGRMVDGKYPNWRAVVPANPFYFEVDRIQMINTLNKTSVTANESTHQVIIKLLTDKITIESEDVDKHKHSEYTVQANIYGPDIRFGVNGEFFVKCLQQFTSGLVRVEYNKHDRALVIKGAEEKGVLTLCMPTLLDVNDAEEAALIKAWQEAHVEPVVRQQEEIPAVPVEPISEQPIVEIHELPEEELEEPEDDGFPEPEDIEP